MVWRYSASSAGVASGGSSFDKTGDHKPARVEALIVSLGVTPTQARPLSTRMKPIDHGNRAYRSSSFTVTVTRP